MNDYIDLYCERVVYGLWSEPLNAISNLSFFLAAWGMVQLVRRQSIHDNGIRLLIGLTVAIGVGSSLFHTFATQWANLLDVLPILLFQLCFIWMYSRRVIKLKQSYVISLVLAFFFISDLSKYVIYLLNGSLSYAPALLILASFGWYHHHHQKQESLILYFASALFLVALFFRSIDQVVCAYFPVGTHFLWHLCNGGLLYLSVRGLALNLPDKAPLQQPIDSGN